MCLLFFNNFWPNNSPSKTMKCFLLHLKSSFGSQDIQIFVFPSSSHFLSVRHGFRAWSKINEVINCLNKNLTQFVWYLEKEKSYDIETFSIDSVLLKEHFYGIFMEIAHQRLVSDPIFILVNKPKQSLHTRNYF